MQLDIIGDHTVKGCVQEVELLFLSQLLQFFPFGSQSGFPEGLLLPQVYLPKVKYECGLA